MATTVTDLRGWFQRGQAEDAEFMIVVCDTFEYEDYPVFVYPGEDVREKAKPYQYGNNMQRVMEVYSLKSDPDTQFSETRAFHYDHF